MIHKQYAAARGWPTPGSFGPAICSLALGLAISANAVAQDLRTVVQTALDSNPELAAIRANRSAIDFELDAARGLRLPTIDVKAAVGKSENGRETSLGILSNHDPHYRRDLEVVASQRVFDGFESRHEIARQRNRVESARWRVADTANSIALRAVQAYLEIQRAEAVLAAARRNLGQLQDLRGRVGARVSAGRGNAGEESEAAARVASGEAAVAEAVNRLRDAEALFRAVVGQPPGRLGRVQVPRRGMPGSVEVAAAEAVIASPSVIATQHDTTAAEAAVGTATSRLFPRLNLELAAERNRGANELSDKDYEARAMLVVRWNLLNGGIDKARIYEAKARAIEAGQINANTRRIIEREVRVSWHAMVSAGQRVPSLERQLAANRRTRATYSQQFETGQRRLLDLLDVQNEVFVSEAAVQTERLIGLYNGFRVLAGMGRLIEALEVYGPVEAATPHASTLVDSWRRNYGSWVTIIDYHWKGSQPLKRKEAHVAAVPEK